jgi:AcrR family transcriptional regulator
VESTSAAPTETPTRLWAGTTLDERRTFRSTALLDAALDQIGESGSAAVTVRSLCRQTGLNDRYFYESFANRDDLLAQLYRRTAEAVQTELLTETTDIEHDRQAWARAVVERFVAMMVDDPRKARLLLVEPMVEPILGGIGLATVPVFTRMIRTTLPKDATKTERTLTAVTAVGALSAVLGGWFSGKLDVTREELVEHCARVLLRGRTDE